MASPIDSIKARRLPSSPYANTKPDYANIGLDAARTGGNAMAAVIAAQKAAKGQPEGLKTAAGEGLIRTSAQLPEAVAAKTFDPGGYTDPSKASGYIQALQSQLGIEAPTSAGDSQKTAAYGQIDEAAHRAAVQQAGRLAASGLDESAIGAALAGRRATDAAGQKAQVGADIEQNQAARMDAFNRILMGQAVGTGQAMTSQDMQRSGMLQNVELANKQALEAQQARQAGLQAQAGGALSDEEFRRQEATYQAMLNQIQQQNTADMMQLQKDEAKKDRWTQIGASLLAGASEIAKAAL